VVLSQFTKVLSIRLMEVAAETISKTQTAFIKGRNILEAVVILHELIHELKTKHQEGIILKLDFEKACDKVNWEFLKEVLVQKGFPGKRIDWIMKTVEGGKVCINVNNEQGEFSRTFKVLRQGGGSSVTLVVQSSRGCIGSHVRVCKTEWEDWRAGSSFHRGRNHSSAICK
jgi:hypothetical protein